MKRVVVLGGGFAGLWAAAGAARQAVELGVGERAEITLVNRVPYHNIRVRNYEADISDVCVPLDDVLEPINVRLVVGDVEQIATNAHRVGLRNAADLQSLTYDRLVVALGSRLTRPPIPGLAEHAFDVDSYEAAVRLHEHLASLAGSGNAASATAVVIGAGLTGIEIAAELPGMLTSALGSTAAPRVILLDLNPNVGSDMGESARPVIEEALESLDIAFRGKTEVRRIDANGVELSTGEFIAAATVVWCGGMQPSPLAELIPAQHDPCGRLVVDEFLRVRGVDDVFAAGDIAAATFAGTRTSVMSCQHGRPMGRFAGHNVVADLFGAPLLPLDIPDYVTCLDLGPWGAVYTEGWDRRVVARGEAAKKTKRTINRERIYPPRTRDAAQILAAAAPIYQNRPVVAQEVAQSS